MFSNVARAKPPASFASNELVFQLLDCTQSNGAPNPAVSKVRHEQVPVVRLYGVTKEGYSVLVHSYNFEPYLWIEAPDYWLPMHSQALMRELNGELDSVTLVNQTVVRIEQHPRKSLMNYSGKGNTPFLKVVVQLPGHIPKLRSLLTERGVMCPGAWRDVRRFLTYESNILFPMRFMIDNNIYGSNWISLAPGSFVECTNRTSVCQIEVNCSFEHLVNHEAVGPYFSIAPFRILSIDIECEGRKGLFPEPEHDPIIQIANHCIEYGKESETLSIVIFTLHSCASIAGATVYSFESEDQMLLSWMQYMKVIDPDVFTGYNISNFDLPYLLNRATTLRVNESYFFWARQVHERTAVKDKNFQSKQMGNREYKEVFMEGRIIIDAMAVIMRDFKLRSYSLNSVSQNFLGEQKEDVHHSIISDLQQGNSETRRRLAVYCLKDAYLPLRLLDRLMMIVNNVEMARVTGVPIRWLLERGQQVKVFSMLLRKAQRRQLVVPTVTYNGGADRGYEGATVIEPIRGFYNCPIATLDFASLYPSIIIAHNLCYSTLVSPSQVSQMDPSTIEISPSGDAFVKKEVFPGILPEVLDDLLVARKNARKEMKNVPIHSLEYKVLNGRQLALKVSANSVYGFTGAQIGKLPCLEISSSTTSYGRTMIQKTKELVEELYPGTTVIYGDTDSVMIKCITDESEPDKVRIETARKFGEEAAASVSKYFLHPIKLEFEKIYFPYLLLNKKRYAGLLWTNCEAYDKLDTKGIETVRRDNCPLVARMVSGVLNRILIHRSVEDAVAFVKGIITDLLMNRLDISNLVITKAFSKSEEQYAATQAHVELVKRMRQRDPASAPSIGDRVAYVIIKAVKGAKAHERSEDPIYVLENNIPLDTQYYLEHHLTPPIMRLFEGLHDLNDITKGKHTSHIFVSTPSASLGGLMKFVKFNLQCIRCRANIESGALCAKCLPAAGDVYCKIVAKRNHFEALFSQAWTQCQQCQGSLTQEVICSSRDCPVFYMRKKAQKDLREQQTLLDRFGVMDDW